MNEKAKTKLKEIARNANRTLKTQKSEGTKGQEKSIKGEMKMETKQLNPMEDPAYKKMLEDVKTARKKREIRGSAPYGMTTVTGKRGRLSPEGRESVKKLSAININL